jgi:elongation factor G
MPAIQKGFEAAMQNGPLANYPIESMKVNVLSGSYHEVDSDSLSFEMCARLGFREAAKKADPVLLEPIMAVEVTSPEEFIGSVTGDLNKRRGIMKGIESKGNGQIVKADVPLAELFGYVTDLRTITSGRAAASLTFLKYEIVPKQLADKIIDKVKNNN